MQNANPGQIGRRWQSIAVEAYSVNEDCHGWYGFDWSRTFDPNRPISDFEL